MLEKFFKKLNIKTKPEKILTYIFYAISIVVAFFSLTRLLSLAIGSTHISDSITIDSLIPYGVALLYICPVLAFSFFVNSGLAKNDDHKIKMFMFTCTLLALAVLNTVATGINWLFWTVMDMLPNFDALATTYPELVIAAVRALCLVIPFISITYIVDYFLSIYNDEDLTKSIAGYVGLTVNSSGKKATGFDCDTVIGRAKGTSVPIVVPEKKRYEATLVQGATGTGKTATVLLPMSALDLEKKFFFREYAKKIGYSMLKRGIAYMNGPYDNRYINRNFSLSLLRPKNGMEDQFDSEVRPLVQYKDNATGATTYRNLGVTIVENDGNFISQFIGVAKNFDIDVLSIDPASPETTLSINPFAIPDPAKVASIVADVLMAMYGSESKGTSDPFFTQVTIDAFQNLSILLKEMYPILHNGEIASLEDMLELLYNFDAVEEMTEEMKKIPELEQKYKLLIKYFEKNFYKPSLNINGYEIPGTRGSGRKDTEKFLYGAITQLNNLVRHPGLKAALCGKKNIIDFDKALADGSVITACSRKGDLGIIQAKAFGMFFILQFQDAVLRRKGNEESRTPHFLYIDEFPEYITKDMEVMFTLFRKYRCGVTVAIQNLSQLEKSGHTYYRQTVLANTKTQIVFGDTVYEDSKYWSEAFGKEKKADKSTGYSLDNTTGLKGTTKIDVKDKERIKIHKLAELGFGSMFYKTKSANGKTVFGEGKTTFLDGKYKEKQKTLMFNFEKYMMSKPDAPTITMNDSDTSTNDDKLFGVNTTGRLKQELKKEMHESNVNNNQNYIHTRNISNSVNDDFEIVFDNANVTLDKQGNGNAITEHYESPIIKRNKK
ncbi:MAG: TraM recognition domain-containing protein [Clostridia bacterium]|nr:TraM recognition domain-containing protein [Clostridia bacterium]